MNDLKNTEIIKTSQLSYKYGAIGGILTSLLLVAINNSSGEAHPMYVALLKYIPLGLVVFLALNILQKTVEKKSIFGKGASIAFSLSIVAGLLVAAVNMILYIVNPEWSFDKFGRVTTSLQQAATVTAMLFFEILVVTNLIAFVILQYIKRDVKL